MSHHHKDLDAVLNKIIEHVQENIRNQSKLSSDMKRFRKERRLRVKNQNQTIIEKEKDEETYQEQ